MTSSFRLKFLFAVFAFGMPLWAATIPNNTGLADCQGDIKYGTPYDPYLAVVKTLNNMNTSISDVEFFRGSQLQSTDSCLGTIHPTVSSNAGLTQTGDGGGLAMEASATMNYFVRVVPIIGGFFGVNLGIGVLHVQATQSASVSGTAGARTAFGFGSLVFPSIEINGVNGPQTETLPTSLYLPLIIVVGTEYRVTIGSSVGVYGELNSSAPAFASAMVDPVFTLAPELQGLYEVQVSPNVNNFDSAADTPEPRSFALFTIGIVILGVAVRKKVKFLRIWW